MKKTKELEELKVCPVMTCDSFLPFPDLTNLPCAKHGIEMVYISEQPLRKTIYRYIKSKLLGYKYITHKAALTEDTNNE